MTAHCTCSETVARLSHRIDALQSDLTEARADFEHGQRQIFLAVEYGNELAEGKRPAVKPEPSPWTPRVLRGGKAAS